MFDFFKRLFTRKPRIIPFYTMSDDEKDLLEAYRKLTPENKCKILSFKYYNGNLASPHLASGYEPPGNPTDDCKLDFIWDHLEARQ